ncbi:hypothetical protein BDP27DRAFT_442399 [Rhodocollybia butyracea]|uniref:Uncharacterized protein n=1 Tax=Rhodocollybia butyracea TaxID=206335 RepID=A0A9P5TZV9_9AGAR|nr:hypothetical protein BDP27DRAFT_442399 [Rhodocollybia butyracea]
MRSTALLFTLLASSILGVFLMPVLQETRSPTYTLAHPRPSLKRPAESSEGRLQSKKQKTIEVVIETQTLARIIVTFIDRMGKKTPSCKNVKMGQYTQHIFQGYTPPEHLPPEYRGEILPVTSIPDGHDGLRQWIYFIVTGYLDCDEDNPCFGWIVRGARYSVEQGRPQRRKLSDTCFTLYAGISRGKPKWNGFEGEIGLPSKPSKPDLQALQQREWRKLKNEFNARFKADGLALHDCYHQLLASQYREIMAVHGGPSKQRLQ